VPVLELPEQGRQDIFGDRGASADDKNARHIAGDIPNPDIHLVVEADNPLGVLEHPLSRGRETNPVMGPVEKAGV